MYQHIKNIVRSTQYLVKTFLVMHGRVSY